MRAEWRREWEAELAHAWATLPADATARARARILKRSLLSLRDAALLGLRHGRRAAQTRQSSDADFTSRWIVMLNGFSSDVRLSLRTLLRRPSFTVLAVLTLALGVGANTAVFGVVNTVLIRPLPYASAERLVQVWPGRFVANRELAMLREDARSLEEIAVFSPGWLTAVTGIGEPAQVNAGRVSGNLFSLLGIGPEHGRVFGMEAEVPGGERVVVLGHETWQREFGGDDGIVGRTVILDRIPHAVIGIMPPGFQVVTTNTDIWLPLPMDPAEFTWQVGTGLPIARLADGATTAAATAEARRIAERAAEAFDQVGPWTGEARVEPLKDIVVGDLRTFLLVLLGAVTFLLLIAAANVANLLLVRASERRHEIAVRHALGAGPARVLRLYLVESAWLALLGGAAGLGLAFAGVRIVRVLLPPDMPRLGEIGIDAGVLAMCALVSLIAALAFGAVPALASRRGALDTRLRHGRTLTRSGGTGRGVLIAVESALAVTLVVGATLMARTMLALSRVDPGFQTENLLTMRVQPAGRTAEQRILYWREVLARVSAIPGVLGAGTVLHLPMAGRTWTASYEIEGRELPPTEPLPQTAWQSVSAGYLDAAGIARTRGRSILATDGPASSRIVVVNEAFARAAFPGVDPIGQRIRLGNVTRDEWAEIVGVVSSVRHQRPDTPPAPEVYVPFEQSVVAATALVVRTRSEPAAIMPALRERIWSVDPDVPIAQVQTMQEVVSGTLQRPRATLVLLSTFAGIGVALGIIGIYGVVAFGVRQRLREIGIRVALGAGRRAVTTLVVGHAFGWALLGVAAGVPLTLALTGLLRGLVFGVSPTDPATFVAIPLGLLAVAALASFVPARRALRIDPAGILKD